MRCILGDLGRGSGEQTNAACLANLLERRTSQRKGVVLCLAAMVAGCSESSPRDADDASQEHADNDQDPSHPPGLCTSSNVLPIDAGAPSTTEIFDYVSVREWSGPVPREMSNEWTLTNFTVVSETGRACTNATTDCSKKISHHPVPSDLLFCPQLCVQWSVVTTRNDEVRHWSRPAEILELLGDIDTVDDALMVVVSHGYSLNCPPTVPPDYPAQIRINARRLEDGFEVIATRPATTCPFVIRRYTLHVSPTGQVGNGNHRFSLGNRLRLEARLDYRLQRSSIAI